jgi:dipeptidyl aminopeptidase/acylaminoacyl peptidase
LTQITHGSDAYYPNLSPDGTKVAYFDDQGLSLIDVLNGETVQVDPGNDLYSLGWSPDSRYLAFASNRTGNSDIFVVNVETLTESQITATAQDEFIPLWSPDGRTILLTRQEGNTSLYLAPSDGQGGERSIKKDIRNLNYLFWTKSGEIAYGDQDQLNIISLEGHFSFKDVVLDSRKNLFYVISTDSSDRMSPPSDEISVVFDTSQTPDLEVTVDDILIYPSSPIEGEEAVIDVVVWNQRYRSQRFGCRYLPLGFWRESGPAEICNYCIWPPAQGGHSHDMEHRRQNGYE